MKSLIFLITLSISLNSSAGWVLAKEQYAYQASKKDGLRKIMRIANNLMWNTKDFWKINHSEISISPSYTFRTWG